MAKKSIQQLGPLQLEWLEALESGKFEQGQTCLKKDNKFCCLGVACELSGITAIPAARHGVVRYEYLGERHYLPKEIVDRLKFRSNQGDAFSGNLQESFKSAQENSGLLFKAVLAGAALAAKEA